MQVLRRSITPLLVALAALALALGGPVHRLVEHSPHGHHEHAGNVHGHGTCGSHHHDHHHAHGNEHSSPSQPAEDSHDHDAPHSCPVCLLLASGAPLPVLFNTPAGDDAFDEALAVIAVSFFGDGDQQLPGARAPPRTALT